MNETIEFNQYQKTFAAIRQAEGPIALVYHGEDFDGWYSQFLMELCIAPNLDYTLIPGDFSNKRITAEHLKEYKTIIMVDYSLVPSDMQAIASRLIWIDHHKRNYENILSELELTMRTKPEWWILDHTKAACELCLEVYATAWKRDVHEGIVDLLGSYDVWRKDREDWDDIVNFQYGLQAIQGTEIKLSSKIREDVMNGRYREHGENIFNIKKNGKIIIDYLATMFEKNIRNGNYVTYVDGGYQMDVLMLNSTPAVGSRVFEVPDYNGRMVLDTVDVGMTYRWTGKNWLCGFYSSNPEVDCSKIAVKYGGGGHPGASGCTMTDEQLKAFPIFVEV